MLLTAFDVLWSMVEYRVLDIKNMPPSGLIEKDLVNSKGNDSKVEKCRFLD